MRAQKMKYSSQGRRGWGPMVLLGFLMATAAFIACNKTFDNKLQQDYGADGGAGKKQKCW
ncbi:hypothetical protein [Paraflavitalea speifideaquila]|uniref:hypothetical protein n=1 Tax=Paraflavitalea speifideaquila TaxID=3076558 RepID=UPI0028F055B5|nr:hypothetical protein [Paraflavitalea speifideiaquila]